MTDNISEENKEKLNPNSEQEQIIKYNKKGNILVSASAGSGKTHTMIQRIIRIIAEERVPVTNILAVTFTNASAIDMKEKLKKALMEKIAENGESDNPLSDEDIEFLALQASQVNQADISTIHTFCSRIIRQYFFICGALPDFAVMDDETSEIIKSECADEVFEDAYMDENIRSNPFFDRFVGKNNESIKETVKKIYEFTSGLIDEDSFLSASDIYATKENLNNIITQKEKIYRDLLNEGENKFNELKSIAEQNNLAEAVETLDTNLTEIAILKSKDIYGANICISTMLKKFAVGNKTGKIGAEIKTEIKGIQSKIKSFIKDFLSVHKSKDSDIDVIRQHKENNDCLIYLVKRFGEIYSKRKSEDNVLDFNDLERYALIILNDKDTAKEIREKYKYVFVDECQDINGVQNEIINKLSDNNLFMVGDIKQSIYGFRGCSPDFFADKERTMNANGEMTKRLNKNYRSAPKVIDMVNKIFNYCMTKEYFGEDYKKESRLADGGKYPEGAEGRAELHFFDTSLSKQEKETKTAEAKEEPRIYDIYEEIHKDSNKNTTDVTSLVVDIINNELTKTYYDIKSKDKKPDGNGNLIDDKYKQITYSDIAILSRAIDSDKIERLVESLRKHDIPVESDVKCDIREFTEIAMMTDILSLVDCFLDDIPLVSVLRSPVCNLSNEELAEISCFYLDTFKHKSKTFHSAFNYFIHNADKNKDDEDYDERVKLLYKLKSFKAYFDNLRYLSDFIGCYGVLEKVINDFNIVSYLLGTKLGKSKITRLNHYLSASLAGDKRLTVREFLYKVRTCPDAFKFPDDSGESCVKVVSMHKSKGLEYPVVIVVGAEKSFNSKDYTGKIIYNKDFGIMTKYFNDEKRVFSSSWLTEQLVNEVKRQQEREEMRLFYVATTRAKYSLHIIFSDKEDKRKGKFAGASHMVDYIPNDMSVTRHDAKEFEFIDLKKNDRTVLLGKADETIKNDIIHNLDFKYKYLPDTVIPLKTNVTSAVNSDTEDVQLVHVVTDGKSPDIERGIIAHKIMECFDFNSAVPFEEQVKSIVERGILTAEQVDKISLERLKNTIISGTFSNLKNCKLYREKPFLVNVPANMIMDTESSEMVLVQGVIDLLIIDGDSARIVDYKYSSLDNDSLKLKYKKQLDLYAYAVNKVLDKTIAGKTLINLYTGETVGV